MNEAELQAAIQLAHSREGCRLFRMNAGWAWQGTIVSRTTEQLVLRHPYRVRLGPEGIADLIGWADGGAFLAVEVKGRRGRLTEAQDRFLALVRAHGGRAGVAYSLEDAARIIHR